MINYKKKMVVVGVESTFGTVPENGSTLHQDMQSGVWNSCIRGVDSKTVHRCWSQ